MEGKVCSKCGVWKPLEEYYKKPQETLEPFLQPRPQRALALPFPMAQLHDW